ncbi:MAG: PilZ domain-containing protein [Myxococcota bacterium]
MDPAEWLAGFRATHQRAKSGQLKPEEVRKYLAMREEFARSLVAAQGLAVPEGQQARRYFRVAQLYPLEVANLYQTVTRELSRSGFSALITGALQVGEVVEFKLSLGRGAEPVLGQARVVSSVRQTGNARVSFAIDSLSDADAERIELALFDAVLARFA